MTKMAYYPSAMSQISHELRIPLTGIMGMVHFLSETQLTPIQKEYLQILQTSADRLFALEDKLQALVKKTQ